MQLVDSVQPWRASVKASPMPCGMEPSSWMRKGNPTAGDPSNLLHRQCTNPILSFDVHDAIALPVGTRHCDCQPQTWPTPVVTLPSVHHIRKTTTRSILPDRSIPIGGSIPLGSAPPLPRSCRCRTTRWPSRCSSKQMWFGLNPKWNFSQIPTTVDKFPSPELLLHHDDEATAANVPTLGPPASTTGWWYPSENEAIERSPSTTSTTTNCLPSDAHEHIERP